MSLVGFEPTVSTDERPQTYALDRAATGIGFMIRSQRKKTMWVIKSRRMKRVVRVARVREKVNS